MDPNTTAVERTSCLQEDAKTFLPVNETSVACHVLELIRRGQAVSQDDLDKALISACQRGHKAHICGLIHRGANVQKKDIHGNTPLLICAENGFVDVARILLTQRADINTKNFFGDNALILSIHPARSVEMVKLLLEQKRINISHKNKDGYTALMKAVEAKDIQLIRLLLCVQKNPGNLLLKAKNCRNETAQDIADRVGIGNAVRLLSQHKNRITTALLAASQTYDVDSFKTLIDCPFSDAQEKRATINTVFERIFCAHKWNEQTFKDSEVEILKKLLECGADPNKHHDFDPLLIAIKVGSYSVVQLLCKHGADLYSHSMHKNFVDIAAGKGRVDLLELLLKYKTKINKSSLDVALKHGHTDCAKLLIKHGATIDIKSAFTTAVIEQLPENLKFLLQNFKYEVRRFARTKVIRDLLVSAAEGGNLEIIGLIIDAGADVNCTNKHGKTALMRSKNGEVVHFLVQKGAIINRQRCFNLEVSTPLTYIMSCDSFGYDLTRRSTIIQALLEHGADVNGKSGGGRTALMIAASKKGCTKIMQMFLEFGADLNIQDNKGNTALLIAAQQNLTENLKCLLQFTKDLNSIINVKNNEGLTALMVVSWKRNHLAMKDLIDRGADVNVTDCRGNTALLHALTNTSSLREDILTTLIKAGCDINVQNNDGLSPLMLAAKNSMIDSIKVLVNFGVDINAKSKDSATGTALEVLLDNAHLRDDSQMCMEYLLDHGARASYIKPNMLHWLVHYGQLKFVPKLIQAGLGPADVTSIELPPSCFTGQIVSAVSPLCMALLTGYASLARYFIGNSFLTSSDVSSLTTNKNVQCALEEEGDQECLEVLEEMSTQVMSLFTLAFVATQSAVGTSPGREERVNMLPLPRVIKDRLLFKTEDVHLDTTVVNKPSHESISEQLRLLALMSLSDMSQGYYGYDSDLFDFFDYDSFDYDSDW